jgi:NAD+ diphosphatase
MRDAASELSARTGFAFNPLDRMSERRDEEELIGALAAARSSRAVVICRDSPVVLRHGPQVQGYMSLAEAESLGPIAVRAFLGKDEHGGVFGVLLDDAAAVAAPPGPHYAPKFHIAHRSDAVLEDLRALTATGQLDPATLGAIGQAKSLLHWHARHRFCANCGEKTHVVAAGWRRECPACGAQHFPRTDPVVIMHVVHGDECLMGRQSRFPPGMYSCLAGFVEAGETLEDAVRREVFEEAGLHTGRVAYLASQPWPFPSSLMIGCLAEAQGRDLVVDHHELEDARWFSREEVGLMFRKAHPQGLFCPPKLAIAHHLLAAWARGGTGA